MLKAEQEVPAAAGARVVLNYNNKVATAVCFLVRGLIDACVLAG